MVERAASLYRLSLDRAYWYIWAMPLPAHFSELLPQMKSLALLPNTLWKDDAEGLDILFTLLFEGFFDGFYWEFVLFWGAQDVLV